MINCIAMLLWPTHIIIITPDLYYDHLHCNGFKLTNTPLCAFSYISPLYSGVPLFSPLYWPAVQVHFTFFKLFYQFSFPRHRQHSNVCTIQHRAPHSREGSRLRQWSLIPECQSLWWGGWVECETLDGFRLIHARDCCLWMKMIKLDCAGKEKKWKLSKTL